MEVDLKLDAQTTIELLAGLLRYDGAKRTRVGAQFPSLKLVFEIHSPETRPVESRPLEDHFPLEGPGQLRLLEGSVWIVFSHQFAYEKDSERTPHLL